MRWEGRRQSDNIEDRRGMRVSRGGLVGGGLGTLAIALLVMFLGGDPTPILQGAGNAPVETTSEPYVGVARGRGEARAFVATMLAETEDALEPRSSPQWAARTRSRRWFCSAKPWRPGAASRIPASGPFYCPPDEGVFLDMTFFDEMAAKLQAGGDFAYAYVVAHEVGHHVQNRLGISDRVQKCAQRVERSEGNQLSVRIELQADCFAGVWAHHAQQAQASSSRATSTRRLAPRHAIGDDRLQRSAGPRRPGFLHARHFGTAQRWFTRGIETGSLEACDTFKAADL